MVHRTGQRGIFVYCVGSIWIGTYGGLTYLKNNSLKLFTMRDGLASNLVRSLYEDREGTLWIGSYDGGLTRLKDGKFTRYTSNDGLFNDGVFQILEDGRGNLWMSCNRGIYRVAAELHGGLSQSLEIIKNRAVLSLTAPDNTERAFEQMEEISQAATEAMFEAKGIIYDLRPIQLDRFGLTKAIKAMLKKIGDSHELELTTEIERLDNQLSKEAESNLYRILQESMNNVVRHSQATAARVSMRRQNDFVTMTIQDNGTGFQPGETARNELRNEHQNGGFGLLGIVERARLLNGRAEIQSALGSGTTITISLPVKENSFVPTSVQSENDNES